MSKITVNLNPSYSVVIEKGGLEALGAYAKEVLRAEKVLIVSDAIVAPLYLKRARESLVDVGYKVFEFVIAAGEQSKNPVTYLQIINALAEFKFKRTDAVVALGGGVVGDIAGFCAATYMRGIDVIQVPTTLLAMIDSSIGGKTGVDLEQGKNLLGAFHQPKLVLADPKLLKSLPEREWFNGAGEGAKYACLAGGRIAEIFESGENALEEFIELCAKYKADIVAKDEKEGGLRALLNLGHTVGHAVESARNFEIPHGIAVAYGIAHMARAAYNLHELNIEDYSRILTILNRIGIIKPMPLDSLIFDFMSMDKKSADSKTISIVKIKGLGNCVAEKTTFDELKSYLMTKDRV